MHEEEPNTSIDQLLSALASVLAEERNALIRVDAEGIERATASKDSLQNQLTQRRREFSEFHCAKLQSIQTDVRHNLILLVHARDHIQGTLGILTGRSPVSAPFQKHVAESVRLDLRG